MSHKGYKMKEPLVSIKNIHAQYGAIKALTDVSLEIHQGEIVTLIGANGAGKSTLLMSLFSQPRISQGQIIFDGQPIHQLSTHEISKLQVSISPEGRRVFPKMTVLENLELGALGLNSKNKFNQHLEKAYTLFPVLKERATQRAGTLSGGEQQMLAIARSLMAEPKLFLLDEPSLGLAPQIVKQIFSILKEINQAGTTIFLVEQNAFAALNLANRGYVLTNGEITLQGDAKTLLNHQDIKKAYLGH